MALPVENATSSWAPDANATVDPGAPFGHTIATSLKLTCIKFIGLFLNVLAAVAWSRPGCSPRLRTCPNVTRAALIWVDLISIFLYIVRTRVSSALKTFNYDLYCDIFGFTNITFSLASGLIAGVRSVDRFAALQAPFSYQARFTPKRITVAILLMVFFAVIVGSLPFLGIGSYHNVNYFHGLTLCKVAWFPNEPPLYVLHFAVYQAVGWCLLLVVVVCNIGVMRCLLRMRKHMAFAGTYPGMEVRFLRTMMLVTVFFAICWLPWMITTILIKVGSQTTMEGDLVATYFLLCNAAFDPLIFMITSEVMCSRVRNWAVRCLRWLLYDGQRMGRVLHI